MSEDSNSQFSGIKDRLKFFENPVTETAPIKPRNNPTTLKSPSSPNNNVPPKLPKPNINFKKSIVDCPGDNLQNELQANLSNILNKIQFNNQKPVLLEAKKNKTEANITNDLKIESTVDKDVPPPILAPPPPKEKIYPKNEPKENKTEANITNDLKIESTADKYVPPPILAPPPPKEKIYPKIESKESNTEANITNDLKIELTADKDVPPPILVPPPPKEKIYPRTRDKNTTSNSKPCISPPPRRGSTLSYSIDDVINEPPKVIPLPKEKIMDESPVQESRPLPELPPLPQPRSVETNELNNESNNVITPPIPPSTLIHFNPDLPKRELIHPPIPPPLPSSPTSSIIVNRINKTTKIVGWVTSTTFPDNNSNDDCSDSQRNESKISAPPTRSVESKKTKSKKDKVKVDNCQPKKINKVKEVPVNKHITNEDEPPPVPPPPSKDKVLKTSKKVKPEVEEETDNGEEELTQMPWYHDVTKEVASKTMKPVDMGVYLVRPSDNNQYVLMVRLDDLNIKKFKIQQHKNGWILGEPSDTKKIHKDIVKLMAYYKEHGIKMSTFQLKLKEPAKKI